LSFVRHYSSLDFPIEKADGSKTLPSTATCIGTGCGPPPPLEHQFDATGFPDAFAPIYSAKAREATKQAMSPAASAAAERLPALQHDFAA
jgi:hypothetical protein